MNKLIPKCNCKDVYPHNNMKTPSSFKDSVIPSTLQNTIVIDGVCKFCGYYPQWHKENIYDNKLKGDINEFQTQI